MVARRRFLVLVGLALVLSLVLPTTAMAAYDFRSTYSFSGRNADAYSSAVYPDGSTFDAALFGGYMTGRSNGTDMKPEKINDWSGSFYMTSYTPASKRKGAVYRDMNAWAPASFVIDRKLTAASVSYSCIAEIYEWYGPAPWDSPDGYRDPDSVKLVPVDVAATWTGVGGLYKQMSISKTSGDGFFTADRNNSTIRDAKCSATVTGIDGTAYFNGTFDMASMYDTISGGTAHYAEVPW